MDPRQGLGQIAVALIGDDDAGAGRGENVALPDLEIEIEMRKGMILDRAAFLTQCLEFGEPLDRLLPTQREAGARQAERGLQYRVGEPGAGIRRKTAARGLHRYAL